MTTARELLQEALKRTRAELLERAEREEQERDALKADAEPVASMKRDLEKFRDVDNTDCGLDWFISRVAWHLDRAAQPEPAAKGDVVVTWDEGRTRIVAVTRQDEEGHILSVIAEAPKPEPSAEPDLVTRLRDNAKALQYDGNEAEELAHAAFEAADALEQLAQERDRYQEVLLYLRSEFLHARKGSYEGAIWRAIDKALRGEGFTGRTRP